jgi:N-formylmaleamate deformylase
MLKLVSEEVAINGVKIHYYRTGGDKPPIVMAHGITDNGLCWIPLAEVLAENYDVVMFDARGHGLSEPNPPDFTIQSHVADLAGLIEMLELEQPVIIGHSMGAGNTAQTAATYPDLARAIILEDPPWGAEAPNAEREAAIDDWRAGIIEQKSQTLAEIINTGKEQNPRWATVNWEAWAEAKHQVNPDVLNWGRSKTFFTGWQEFVPQITCPILLITGDPELGSIVKPETVQKIVALSRQAEVAHVDAVGHSIRRENFEEYVSIIGTFLRRVF